MYGSTLALRLCLSLIVRLAEKLSRLFITGLATTYKVYSLSDTVTRRRTQTRKSINHCSYFIFNFIGLPSSPSHSRVLGIGSVALEAVGMSICLYARGQIIILTKTNRIER